MIDEDTSRKERNVTLLWKVFLLFILFLNLIFIKKKFNFYTHKRFTLLFGILSFLGSAAPHFVFVVRYDCRELWGEGPGTEGGNFILFSAEHIRAQSALFCKSHLDSSASVSWYRAGLDYAYSNLTPHLPRLFHTLQGYTYMCLYFFLLLLLFLT